MTSGSAPDIPRTSYLAVLRVAALVAAVGGAGTSLALMLHAGRHQQSKILLLLFGLWVLCPFLAAGAANLLSKSWPVIVQAALYIPTLLLTAFSLGVYSLVAFGYVQAKVGFIFLMVPLASLLLGATAAGTAALFSRRQAHRKPL